MTVRELINALLDQPMELQVWIDKGTGPLDQVVAHYGPATAVLLLSPAKAAGDDH